MKKIPLRILALALCLSLSGLAVPAGGERPTLPMFGSDANIVHGITYHGVSIERKVVNGEVKPGWCIVKAVTQCAENMGKIGFSVIELIKSGPGIEETVYRSFENQVYKDQVNGEFEMELFVETGYYYHVHVIHYAKESDWLFPKTQSIEDWTGVLYFGE